MNPFSTKNIKKLLKEHGIQPSKGLGQNFLADKSAVKKVAKASSLKPNDVVLEIGPGLGALTQELARKTKKVIAIEKDRQMCEILKELLGCWSIRNIKIVQSDILKLNPKNYNLKTYKIVANLPFYLTTPVIRKFLEAKKPPTEMILMVQKEVGQRIVARPPDMNLLAVAVQIYAKAKIIDYVSKKSFWPQPKVDVAIIKITPQGSVKKSHDREIFHRRSFFKVVRAGFSQPRKQLINNLSQKLKIDKLKVRNWLLKNNIRPEQRAETLTLQNWLKLTENFISSINLPH